MQHEKLVKGTSCLGNLIHELKRYSVEHILIHSASSNYMYQPTPNIFWPTKHRSIIPHLEQNMNSHLLPKNAKTVYYLNTMNSFLDSSLFVLAAHCQAPLLRIFFFSIIQRAFKELLWLEWTLSRS